MRYVILAPTRLYFSDWNEETPVWSSLNDAYQFDTKETALELIRNHSRLDIDEREIPPSFLGCRVVPRDGEVTRLALKELQAKGYRASFNDDCTAIWIDFDDTKIAIEKALATFPRSIYGLSVHLRARGKAIKWTHKRA